MNEDFGEGAELSDDSIAPEIESVLLRWEMECAGQGDEDPLVKAGFELAMALR